MTAQISCLIISLEMKGKEGKSAYQLFIDH